MIDAMEPQRLQPGITQKNFQIRARRRISLEDGGDVLANRLRKSNHAALLLTCHDDWQGTKTRDSYQGIVSATP